MFVASQREIALDPAFEVQCIASILITSIYELFSNFDEIWQHVNKLWIVNVHLFVIECDLVISEEHLQEVHERIV